jgi:hypothetical protein
MRVSTPGVERNAELRTPADDEVHGEVGGRAGRGAILRTSSALCSRGRREYPYDDEPGHGGNAENARFGYWGNVRERRAHLVRSPVVTAKSICRRPVSTAGKGTRTLMRRAPVCRRGCSSCSTVAGQMWGGGAPRTGTYRRCSVLFE